MLSIVKHTMAKKVLIRGIEKTGTYQTQLAL